jgi:hypothetical protein
LVSSYKGPSWRETLRPFDKEEGAMKIRARKYLSIPIILDVLFALSGLLGMALDAGAAPPTVYADFNGDGFDDLAVGVPDEDIGNPVQINAGAVHVLYGSDSGLSSVGSQFLHQNSAGILDTAEAGDLFGDTLAGGDFNGDGFYDLVVGVPEEDIGNPTIPNAGAVNVIYGSASGLSSNGDQFWHQNSSGILDTAESFDVLGLALAAGDFNGDGFDDVAVGVPSEGIGDPVITRAGAVNILYGSATGLSSVGDLFLNQNSAGIPDTAEANDSFGSALAAGDFNGDDFYDLAVGVPQEDIGNPLISGAGAVNILYGSASGLSSTGARFLNQDSTDIEGAAESNDNFGSSLAAGDFDGDGSDDLAVGVPYEDIEAVDDAGAVNILYGSAKGLSSVDDQIWHQDSPDIEGVAESGDNFGNALAAGDFDGDGSDDLAIGAVGEDLGDPAVIGAGAANVLYGSASGLSSIGNQVWHQDSSGILDTAEAFDAFAYALAVGDFNDDGSDDLAVGVAFEGIGDPVITGAGAINVLYGSDSGLSATGDQFWNQDSTGIPDRAELNDFFGLSLE